MPPSLSPSLASRLRLERGSLPSSSQERGNTGRKEDYRWHGSWLKSSEGRERRRGECTIHLEYFLPEGEKGRPQPTSPACPTPTGGGAAAEWGSMVHLLPDQEVSTLSHEGLLQALPLPQLSFHFPASACTIICVAVRTDKGEGRVGVERQSGRRCFLSDHATHLPLSKNSLPSSFVLAYRSLSRRRFPPLAHPPTRGRPELEPRTSPISQSTTNTGNSDVEHNFGSNWQQRVARRPRGSG